MPRTAPSQSIAFDILDWIFFNQLLVSSTYRDEEKKWLQDTIRELQEAVSQTGATGAEAERLKHTVLCLLEVRLGERAERTGFAKSTPLPNDVTPKMILDVAGHNANLFQAAVIASCGKTGGIEFATVSGIFNRVVRKLIQSPTIVGHRLTERALLQEYPDAPLDFFLWMASTGIISSKKYDPEKSPTKRYRNSVARIGMLCEMESIRNWMMSTTHLVIKDETIMLQSEVLSENALNTLLDRLSFYRKLTHGRNIPMIAFFQDTFDNREKAMAFLVNFGNIWKRSRMITKTQGKWIGMLGASMVHIYKTNIMPESPIYVENNNEGSVTQKISEKLCRNGCSVSARTVYESHQFLAKHIRPRLEHYYATQHKLAGVLPSMLPDIAYDISVIATKE